MTVKTPYQQYNEVKIKSCSKQDLIILAYDGAIGFIERCLINLEENHYESVHINSLKAQAILKELMLALDMIRGGEIAANLMEIYNYMIYRLVIGNAKKEKQPFLEVKDLLLNLRSAWVEIKGKKF
ncbi:flagellar export chaperone FliS [bacterium]|jgi:flagellar protein FliS|nr:flagellar export chaperone FliS [bacterium]